MVEQPAFIGIVDLELVFKLIYFPDIVQNGP